MRVTLLLISVLLVGPGLLLAQPPAPLPGTTRLTGTGDLSAQMVAGIDRWLKRETGRVSTNRAQLWSGEQTDAFQRTRRERLREMIGAVDQRIPHPRLQFLGEGEAAAEVFRSTGPHGFAAYRVRWPVLEGVFGEGLLLEPLRPNGQPAIPIGSVLAIPDADQTPEMLAGLHPGIRAESQFARHLAENGCRVLIPVLVNRQDEWSGHEKLKRFTNQPHREWIYRPAYEMGRHIIGFEVQKVLAAVDAIQGPGSRAEGPVRVGVAGYGEGGLMAFYAAALDSRIDVAMVSGYFDEREALWAEPIYRNVFGLLREFGDAEIARLIAPRRLIVEFSPGPKVHGPPSARPGRSGAAPGKITPLEFGTVEAEVRRANELTARLRGSPFVELVHGSEGMAVEFGSARALSSFLSALGGTKPVLLSPVPTNAAAPAAEAGEARQRRAVQELDSFTQQLLHDAERVRDKLVWSHLNHSNGFFQVAATNRDYFWRQVIGKIDAPKLPPNPRTRPIYDQPKWTGYEVMLDVWPDVFAWGYLLVPKDLQPGERRPVVVCQHGLEGLPEDTVTEDPKSTGYKYYRAFAARLVERGFIVYAPHNPYRGGDAFRVLQRQANPLGLSLFSFIIAQHEVTTDWLASLPFVDPERIAFYGLSYGGKTAMRVPAVVERYGLSICSADFNEWIQKNVSTASPYSYVFTGEYEMPEWNLGHTFNYAEMASLIAPRPFMVERGHDDGVAPDAWVASEYAKVRRMYDKLGLGDRTAIEFFDGPHQINGVGTFDFLHQHLHWPVR